MEKVPISKTGVINQKALFQNLYNSEVVRRAKSDKKLSAQTDTQYANYKVKGRKNEQPILSYLHLRHSDLYLYRIVLLLDNYGMRISEVLKIRSIDITPKGLIILKSSKNSNDRIINLPEIREYLLKCLEYKIIN